MNAVIVSVCVTPRAGRDAVVGVRDGVLQVRVAAAPVDGAANRACAALLAQALDVKRSQITLVGGETARVKRFRLDGISAAALADRLTRLPPNDNKNTPA